MSIERKPSDWMKVTVLSVMKAYLKWCSNIVVERNDTLHMKPPYIILANHVNNWDPLFINCFVDEPICFVASDTLFRNPLLRKLLNYTGAIPKTKFKSDSNTIREILKAKKHNRVVAIFPEGNRNWDGTTEPIIYTTAKLVKSLNIPVVAATIRGGYLSHPRWAKNHRKGMVSIELKKLCDKDELQNETIESIHTSLTNALAHDEVQWQQEKQILFDGKNLANYLERLLFLCPHCETPAKLRSHGDLLQCTHCTYTVRYSQLGTLEQVNENPIYFSTPRDWNRWQLDFLKNTFAHSKWKERWKGALNDPVKLYSSSKGEAFKLIEKGTVTYQHDTLVFQKNEEEQWRFPLRELEGVNVQLHHKLDFHREDCMYRLEFYLPHTSAYKWLQVVRVARAEGGGPG